MILNKYLFNSSVSLTEQSVTLRFYCTCIMGTKSGLYGALLQTTSMKVSQYEIKMAEPKMLLTSKI